MGGMVALAVNNSADEVPVPDKGQKICMSYVRGDGDSIPDPEIFTHLIYAFAEFNGNNDGVVINYPDKLQKLSDLKKSHPELKIILGVGGSKYEGFSEMAKDKKKRKTFIKHCKSILKKYNLDGITLDWEYPGTTKGGHSASENDAENYVTLVKELRKSLGKNKWISFFSIPSGLFIDLKGMEPYVDYVEIGGYDLSTPQKGHKLRYHNNLYPEKDRSEWSIQQAVNRHLKAGIPRKKILLGIPFYAHAADPLPKNMFNFYIPQFSKGLNEGWDDIACVPYYENSNGDIMITFDNEKSIGIKCDYIRKMGLAGAFAWHYDADYKDHRLAKAMKEGLKPQN